MHALTPDQLRTAYLDFFQERGHAVIPSAPVVPENDPTVLFTTAGMHPLVPYLLGETHPKGTRLTNAQKCVRTGDLDDVGDDTHLTFFEMLGNWSLGDYFKEEAIAWSFEFLTEVLGIPVERLAVTCFAGDADAPRDEEAAAIWEKAGIPRTRIAFMPKEDNWWPNGAMPGPCGPDTEMFFARSMDACERGTACLPGCACGRWVEIWNDVFMQFFRKPDDMSLVPLEKKNVDTGMGLERTVAMLSGRSSVYDTDVFLPYLEKIRALAANADQRSERIIADHVRTATFILADGIRPSNVDQGYVLRRLIRRAVRAGRKLGLPSPFTGQIAEIVIAKMGHAYPELVRGQEAVVKELTTEEQLFARTLEAGEKHFQKLVAEHRASEGWNGVIGGEHAFHLYDTYGFPIEMTEELAQEQRLQVDRHGYDAAFTAHQAKSRAGAEQKFAGGLADHSDRTVRMHTATHLLHMALRTVLGAHVEQRGSNITQERLRFDFPHEAKLTSEQLKTVEDMVNEQIQKDHAISYVEMTVPEAKEQGVIGVFEDRYGDRVKVYTIGDFSREICGGPHVARSSYVGKFTIQKEEASSKGIRRIKAVVADDPSIPSPVGVAGPAP